MSKFYGDTEGLYTNNSEVIDLRNEVERYEAAIRKHRDQRGDDRCWMDDEELYKVLPEGYIPPARDTRVELCNCVKFIANRHNPKTSYVSPDIEIAKLQKRVDELEETLNQILGWDCLNPEPRTDLCSDLVWLKQLIETIKKS